MIRRYFTDHVARSSAELSYYLLFSLFPSLIFLNLIINSFNLSAIDLTERLSMLLPAQVIGLIEDYILYIAGLKANTLLYAGIVLTIYFVSRAVNSLMLSIGGAYRLQHQHKLNFLVSMLVTVVLLVSIYLLLGLILLSENLMTLLAGVFSIPMAFVKIWNLLRFIIAPIYLFLITTLFYKIVPNKWLKFRQAMPGGIFFVVVWSMISYLFSYYVANIANYSVLYDSLGAFLILMLWFYMSGIILIMGGHLNHILLVEKEEQTNF